MAIFSKTFLALTVLSLLALPAYCAPEVDSITLYDRDSGGQAYSNELTVSVEASGVSAEAVGMIMAQDAAFTVNSTGWLTYQATSEYTLTAGEGARDVFYKVRDASSDESSVRSDSIAIDLTAPTAAVQSPEAGDAVVLPAAPWRVEWTAGDAGGLPAAPVNIYLSTDGGTNWSLVAGPLANSGGYDWSLPALTSTQARISIEVTDNAGNVAAAQSSWFLLDGEAPEVVSMEVQRQADGAVKLNSPLAFRFSEALIRAGAEQAFSINPSVSGAFSWTADNRTMTFTPDGSYRPGADHLVTISTAATDLNNNPLSGQYQAHLAAAADAAPPEITVSVSGQHVWDNDYVEPRPDFSVIITDDNELDFGSLSITLDGGQMSWLVLASAEASLELLVSPGADLEDEGVTDHVFMARIADLAGAVTTKEITGLKVSADAAGVSGPVLIVPTPLNVNERTTMTVAYNLVRDADVSLYIFSPTGRREIAERFAAGTNGGRAAYNEVQVSALSKVTGRPLANGIYVVQLVSGSKVIGRTRLVVFR